VLSVILLAPAFVKLNHIFEDHKHQVCKTPFSNHFHEYEIDCEFYDFTFKTNFYQSLITSELIMCDIFDKTITSQYFYISDYQKLQFSLRGPPLSV
jgi:hypothetical protein